MGAADNVRGALAGGGSYRVGAYQLELFNATEVRVGDMDANNMANVSRVGTLVKVTGVSGRTYDLPCAAIEDAGRLETALRMIMASAGQGPQQATLVRTYTKPNAFADDAASLAAQGWKVSQTLESHPRRGCLRILLLPFGVALLFPPKPRIIVTYVREPRAIPEQPPAAVVLSERQAVPSVSTAIDQLTKLADLRDRGVLTEEEFQAKKRELL